MDGSKCVHGSAVVGSSHSCGIHTLCDVHNAQGAIGIYCYSLVCSEGRKRGKMRGVERREVRGEVREK